MPSALTREAGTMPFTLAQLLLKSNVYFKEAIMKPVILDTNIFVASAFNKRSHSARIIEAIRKGQFTLVWNEQTRRETARIVQKIPPIRWEAIEDLFDEQHCFTATTHPEHFSYVPDPDDRKFAALATASGATLITQDSDLLDVRDQIAAQVLTPGEFMLHH